MGVFILPFLRLVFEILLLAVMLGTGIRELSSLAISLIVFRLLLSFFTRIHQIPYLLEDADKFAWGVLICILKIASEVGIFLDVREDINISTNVIGTILILMIFRNVSEAWSLLAIQFDE